jgi:hypothetical protein
VPDQGLRDFGFTEDDLAAPETEVWPCHWKSMLLFRACGRKWIVGMGGPITLDLVQVKIIAKTMRIKWNAKRMEEMDVMEGEALSLMGEKKK